MVSTHGLSETAALDTAEVDRVRDGVPETQTRKSTAPYTACAEIEPNDVVELSAFRSGLRIGRLVSR